jgi:hypothetical protein
LQSYPQREGLTSMLDNTCISRLTTMLDNTCRDLKQIQIIDNQHLSFLKPSFNEAIIQQLTNAFLRKVSEKEKILMSTPWGRRSSVVQFASQPDGKQLEPSTPAAAPAASKPFSSRKLHAPAASLAKDAAQVSALRDMSLSSSLSMS